MINLIKNHLDKVTKKTYSTGELIFSENESCNYVGIVVSGEISIKSYFSNGQEVTYNVIKSGQMFGNNLIFSSKPAYRGDVIADTDSEIYFVNKESLLLIMKEDDEFLMKYLAMQSDFSKTLNLKIKLLTISSANDRLLYYLTFNNNKISYKTITKLANELYLTRESLSRTIKYLKDKKIIKIDSKTITLMVD